MIETLRKWALSHTEKGRYSPVGLVFHWVMAALVLFQLGWGFYIGWISPGGDKLFAYQVHSAAGLPILVLALLRVAWRLIIPGPRNDADVQGWQTIIASATHYLFYAAFFALPLSGWVMWSALAQPGPLYLAGVVPWPLFPFEGLAPATRFRILDAAEDVHHIFVILLLFLIPAHVGAALKHHFVDRHDVLRGMLPEIPDWEDPRGAGQHKPREPQFQPEQGAG
ncbi:MAG TPA: cytochrome b [Sphingomicrobium sp.]|nr:cytochrome b [Sphingomicrobium sp.]